MYYLPRFAETLSQANKHGVQTTAQRHKGNHVMITCLLRFYWSEKYAVGWAEKQNIKLKWPWGLLLGLKVQSWVVFLLEKVIWPTAGYASYLLNLWG